MLGVGLAIAVSSVVGYLLLALIGRALSPEDFGLFVSYWGVLFGLASSLSTIEQEAAKQSAEGATAGRAPIHRVAISAAVIATAAAALTLLPPVAERLYGEADSRLGVLVVLATLGFAVQFMVRGLLMGNDRIPAYSGIVIAEAAVRLLVLLAVWVTVGVTLGTAAAAVAVGSYAWIGWIRQARRVDRREAGPAATSTGWRAPFARAGSLMLAAALMACMITGYPTMVTAFSGGTLGVEGGIVFAALTVSRVPLLFVAPLQALAVPTIVAWRQDPTKTTHDSRRLLVLGALGVLGIALVGAVAAWFVGPWGVQLAYGANYVVAPEAVAGLVFSACVLGLLQLMSAALVAFGSYRWMIVVWGVSVATTAVWLLLSPLDIVASTVVGAVLGPVAGSVLALTTLWRLTGQDVPAPATATSFPDSGGPAVGPEDA